MKSGKAKIFAGILAAVAIVSGYIIAGPAAEQPAGVAETNESTGVIMADMSGYSVATIGGGCFWCIEAVYEPIDGIVQAVSGYAGGDAPNPNYQLVTSGTSGHAEVVQLYFDPEKVTYEQILQLFFKAHDPTTLNRQGYDVGTQYRSIILTHDDEQDSIARKVMAEAQEDWPDPIVTEIVPFEAFYLAEDYHQDFYERNPDYGYCAAVIRPKMEKLGLEGLERIDILEMDL
jgi:methionine-S-sulfoxide reductase